MFNQILRALGFILCQIILKSLTVESGFQKTPSNTIAVVGQRMQMSCWTNPNETTQWFFMPLGERMFFLVYNGKAVSISFTPRFSVNKFTGIGHHDLTVRNVTMTDAGIYECVVLSRETQGRTTPVSATAELIVLESDPMCSTTISTKDGSIKEFDYVLFRCALNFSGQFTPSMQWSEGKNTLSEIPIVMHSNMSHSMQQLSSVTILQVDAEKNGILITCKTQISETPKKVHYTNASNIPSYLFNWNTTLNVHFGARNATITPRKDRYRPEDVLYCSAVGNPSLSYTWRNLGTNETIAAGPQLALSKTGIDAAQHCPREGKAQKNMGGELKLSSAKIDVKVSVGARNATITPRKDRYRPEDVLYCSADGNPSPSYTWRNLGTNETIAAGPQLSLSKTGIDADQHYTIECIAHNLVAGELKLSSAKIDVKVSGNWQFPFGYVIGAGVGIFCTLAAVFLVRWIQKKLTSRKSRHLTKEVPQNPSPDYDSIPEAEVNESPSMPITPETAVANEDISDGYSALTEISANVPLPVVYSSLEADTIHVEVLPNMASKGSPIYVNITNE